MLSDVALTYYVLLHVLCKVVLDVLFISGMLFNTVCARYRKLFMIDSCTRV